MWKYLNCFPFLIKEWLKDKKLKYKLNGKNLIRGWSKKQIEFCPNWCLTSKSNSQAIHVLHKKMTTINYLILVILFAKNKILKFANVLKIEQLNIICDYVHHNLHNDLFSMKTLVQYYGINSKQIVKYVPLLKLPYLKIT